MYLKLEEYPILGLGVSNEIWGKDDVWEKGIGSYAFNQNTELENSDFLRARASRKNYVLMEDYLAKMRKIYFKATEAEVDWWFQARVIKINYFDSLYKTNLSLDMRGLG